MRRTFFSIILLAAGAWGTSALAEEHAWSFSMSRGRLGVEVIAVSQELRAHFGAPKDAGILVNRVLADTPAHKAGVKVGDVVVAIGGAAIDDTGDVFGALAGKKKADKAEVTVVRDKKRLVLTVTLADDQAVDPFAKTSVHGFGSPLGEHKLHDQFERTRNQIEAMEKRLQELEKKSN